jgi:hypothetical protein
VSGSTECLAQQSLWLNRVSGSTESLAQQSLWLNRVLLQIFIYEDTDFEHSINLGVAVVGIDVYDAFGGHAGAIEERLCS